MRVLSISDQNIAATISSLRNGGVIAHATETCYGLACDLSNPAAVQKLFDIKRRAGDQPVSALFASAENTKPYVTWNEEAAGLAAEQWPGPLTIILPLKPDAPTKLYPTPGGGTTIGLRVSSHPLAGRLAELMGPPLSTTSANLHGQPSAYSAAEIMDQFTGQSVQPDLVLDSGPLPKNPSSKVIDLSGGGMRVVRN